MCEIIICQTYKENGYKSITQVWNSLKFFKDFLRIEKKWKGRRFSKDLLKEALPAPKLRKHGTVGPAARAAPAENCASTKSRTNSTRGSHMGRGEPRPRHQPVQGHFKPRPTGPLRGTRSWHQERWGGALTPTKRKSADRIKDTFVPQDQEAPRKPGRSPERKAPATIRMQRPRPHTTLPHCPVPAPGASRPGPLGRSWQ